jgi:cytochrome P450
VAYDQVIKQPKPVTDWINDWDWLDDQWGTNAIQIWNDVRTQCPMAMTERYGRAFMPVTMEGVTSIAHDTEHFSSVWVSVALPDAKRGPAPPITSDPPEHHGHRRLLLPSFSPKVIAPLEEDLRSYCRDLIAKIGGASSADAAVQFAQEIPVHGICKLLGTPESDAEFFRDWIYRNFQLVPRDNSERARLDADTLPYVIAQLRAKREQPADDLLTVIEHAEIDGVPVADELKVGYVRLMILAGIDTTWSSIGSGLWHFAQHPDQVARLVGVANDDPLWMTAVEEVLRYYAPVTMGRKVIADTQVAGCPVRSGEQVLVTFPAANHDPAAFENPHEFQIDREHNRHVAFGVGVHRCLGSNLARLEVTVALQEWLRAFPHYSLDDSKPTTWANGQVRGPRTIPVRLHQTV